MTSKAQVALIGLGSMGNAMAAKILEKGYDLVVWNRTQKSVPELEAAGLKFVTLAEALSRPIVISMLSNDTAALEVFNETNLASASPETIHINMSTLSLEASKTLASRHASQQVEYIAAPVLGRPIAITSGKLLIVAAGSPVAIERASSLLNEISAKYWNLGPDHTLASLVKLGVNYNLIHALQAIAESVALVESGGVNANTFIEIITHTAFTGSAYAGYGPMIVNRNYTPPGFSIELGLKDVKLVESAADELGLKLPVAPVLHQLFEQALADSSLNGFDWSAVAELTRQRKL